MSNVCSKFHPILIYQHEIYFALCIYFDKILSNIQNETRQIFRKLKQISWS